MSKEPQSNMDRLRAARAAKKHVEIERHIGGASGTFSVAHENATRAAERNARGERVARIRDAKGEREFECMSPPVSEGTTSTGITGTQGTSPCGWPRSGAVGRVRVGRGRSDGKERAQVAT